MLAAAGAHLQVAAQMVVLAHTGAAVAAVLVAVQVQVRSRAHLAVAAGLAARDLGVPLTGRLEPRAQKSRLVEDARRDLRTYAATPLGDGSTADIAGLPHRHPRLGLRVTLVVHG